MMMYAIRSTRSFFSTKLQVQFEGRKQRFHRIKSQILLNVLSVSVAVDMKSNSTATQNWQDTLAIDTKTLL